MVLNHETPDFKEVGAEKQTSKELSYKEFSTWTEIKNLGTYPAWNNFYLKFTSAWDFIYCENTWHKILKNNYPNLFNTIQNACDIYVNAVEIYNNEKSNYKDEDFIKKPKMPRVEEYLKDIEPLMYRAYLIARKHVNKDWELFQ